MIENRENTVWSPALFIKQNLFAPDYSLAAFDSLGFLQSIIGWREIESRFNVPNDAKRYWIKASLLQPSDSHWWPIWVCRWRPEWLHKWRWFDAEKSGESFKSTKQWELMCPAAKRFMQPLFRNTPLFRTEKIYLSVYYEA